MCQLQISLISSLFHSVISGRYCDKIEYWYANGLSTKAIAVKFFSHTLLTDCGKNDSLVFFFCFLLLLEHKIFERILYIWAIRHPASGYVQGINDLVTPFFVVFLSEYLTEGKWINIYVFV